MNVSGFKLVEIEIWIESFHLEPIDNALFVDDGK
jgi:hypothetical protein